MSTKSLRTLRTLSLSILLSMLLIPVLPAWAEGGGDAVEEHSDDVVILTVEASEPKRESVDDKLGSSEDLLDSYLDQRLKEQLPKKRRLLAAKGVGDRLTGNDAVAYGVIKEAVQQIAAGERPSTTVEVPIELVCDKTTFSAEDLGVSAIMIGGVLNPEVDEALNSKVAIDFPCIVQALLSDCPYDLYWFDKKTGYAYAPFSCSYNSSSVKITTNPFIQFAVDEAYAGDEEYTVSTPVGGNVTNAINDAASIVNANADKPSFERLQAYKQAICDRVRYDDVASSNPDSSNGGPWQLISVFDDDPDTNVVCEGYSKAFKYLCDLSGFNDIECKLVSGTMSGGTGAGNHMWNVLAMPDGKNYLVDITNCDEGSAGFPDELFLKGFSSEDTATFEDGSTVPLYGYETSGGPILYVYDSETLDTYDLSELVMSATDFDPSSGAELIGISSAVVQASDVTYDGTPQEPALTVILDGVSLVPGTDYNVVSYADNVNAGTATVTVGGIGSYEGTATGTFTILPKQVTPVVTLSATSFTYDGTEQLPVLTSVTVDGVGLDASTYTVSEPEGCTDAGTYTFTVALKGNYAGSGTASFVIEKADQTIDVAAKTLCIGKTVELGAIASGGGALSFSSGDESVVTVDESGALTGVRVGAATITITAAATNNYEAATADVEVSVVAQSEPLSLKDANVSFAESTYIYDGLAKEPEPIVRLGENTLTAGVDYKVDYANNTNAGTATVTITGKGNYTGSTTVHFTIGRAKIAVPKAKSGLVYSGKAQVGVAAGTGYTLSGTTKATKTGSYTAYATPDANHAWSDGTTAQKKLAWSIAAKKVTPKVTLAKTSYVYDGGVKKPAVTVMVGSTKLTTSDYTVTYASGRKLVGTYKVTVKLRGNYSGSKSVTFNIIPKGTAISKVTTASKGFTVVWKKQATQTNGYQIQYSTSKTFASGNKTVTVSKTGTTSKKVGSLKAKKVYYVRVRTYRKVGSRTYYSAWSAPKSVKTQ